MIACFALLEWAQAQFLVPTVQTSAAQHGSSRIWIFFSFVLYSESDWQHVAHLSCTVCGIHTSLAAVEYSSSQAAFSLSKKSLKHSHPVGSDSDLLNPQISLCTCCNVWINLKMLYRRYLFTVHSSASYMNSHENQHHMVYCWFVYQSDLSLPFCINKVEKELQTEWKEIKHK